ncbi:hypothetical protein EIP91_010060 [Steccherinum ochraceum]|uniref:SET domain-containing protein n=1 Tax=Steccherinum ochraceum TaxID=92696 RepID=A0A4R0R3J2_9APHY|nr:hypothetical protein EIP91_010060 [Steccherinum ochraceum]
MACIKAQNATDPVTVTMKVETVSIEEFFKRVSEMKLREETEKPEERFEAPDMEEVIKHLSDMQPEEGGEKPGRNIEILSVDEIFRRMAMQTEPEKTEETVPEVKVLGKMPHGVVEDPGLPEDLKQYDAKAQRREWDASTLDYKDEQMINTTLPMRFSPTGELLGLPPNVAEDGQSECYISGYLKRKIALTSGIGSPLPRVEVKTYRIAEVPGKGAGMLADRDITAGELILAERPLLVVPSNAKLMRAPPPNADQYTKAQVVRMMQQDTEKVYELAVERMEPEQREAFGNLKNSHENDGSGPILGRVRTNGFGFDQMRDFPRGGKPGANYCIICDDLSRLNHSCRPNTDRYWDMASFSVQLRAARNIKKDEEITAHYCIITDSFAERQATLEPYDFRCVCPSCLSPKTSDARREKLRTLLNANAFSTWSATDFELPKTTQVKPLLDGVSMSEAEGLESTFQHGFLLFLLMKTYAARGDVVNMRVYARRYSVWRLACRGTVVDEDEVENGFGLVTAAEILQKMRGKLPAGGDKKKRKPKAKSKA